MPADAALSLVRRGSSQCIRALSFAGMLLTHALARRRHGHGEPDGKLDLPVERDRHFVATKMVSAYAEEAREHRSAVGILGRRLFRDCKSDLLKQDV